MEKLILNRIEKLAGYGNPKSNIWFIGIEEGFNGNTAQLQNRFTQTYNLVFADVINNMKGVTDHEVYYGPKATKVQGTMRRIVQILQAIENDPKRKSLSIRDYQKEYLGRNNTNCNHAILELSSLPNPKVSSWLQDYTKSGISDLSSRKIYNQNILPKRIKYLRNLINDDYNPKVVVCYSYIKDYLKRWEELIGINTYKDFGFYRHYQKDGKHFFVTPHTNPMASKVAGYGSVSNKEWAIIQEAIVQAYNS